MKKNKKVVICLILIFLVLISVILIFTRQNNKNNIKEKEVFVVLNDDITITIGESTNIELVKIDNETYTYESNDINIAYVDENGRIEAKSKGTATIKITSSSGDIKECTIRVLPLVDSVQFDVDEIRLKEKEKKKIVYTVLPEDAKIKTIEWISSDTSVATVDNDGNIVAVSSGTAIISVTINDFVKKTVRVEVYGEPKSITLDKKEVKIKLGESFLLKSTIEPSIVEDNTVKWTTSNAKVATVSSSGKVTATGLGTATITVSTVNNKTYKCNVIVEEVEADSITLNKTNINIAKNEIVQLSATINPNNVTDKTLKWESSDTSVATVSSSGKVTAKKTGTVVITVTSKNNKKATATINFKNNTYNKTAIFFGDSITDGEKGTPSGYSWANYIGDHYDLKKTVNSGKRGWLISNALGEKWITNNVKMYNGTKYDYIILHGGTNDIHKGVNLGTYVSSDFSGKYDTTTFLGGLETYLYTVKKQWPNAKIGYIINYETPLSSENRRTLSEQYYTYMKKVLDKWGVKYIDLYFGYATDGQKYSDLLKVDTKIYLPDGLHLNAEGYKLISPYIYNWMNTI